MNKSTPLNAFLYWEQTHPEKIFLRQPLNGEWNEYSYRKAGEMARRMASVLTRSVAPHSQVALLSKNCAEWIITDLAIMMSNLISVPIYPTLSAESIKPLLEHSEAKLIVVGKLDAYDKKRDGIPASITKICFDGYGLKDGLLFSDIVRDEPEMKNFSAPLPSALATIMYSSGTTGTPKGVMLTHGAFGYVGENVAKGLGITSPERFFSYLPLSHIAERGLMEMVALDCGGTISFTESIEKFQENLQHEQPTIFGGVPRIYAKFQEGVLKKLPQKKLSMLLSIPVIGAIIKKSIHKKLGMSRARVIVSGAAPTPVTLLHWFKSIGITIREIYGMTENTAFSHANFQGIKIGTVGQPWHEVECRLGDDGEILVRHRALMTGYYKDPETTAGVFTPDGFLKTGDQGEVDDEGFLTITGRVKDQFKSDKGKFIAPAQIELKLLSNTDIEQTCVVGLGLPQPIALVVVSAIGSAKDRVELNESLENTLAAVNESLENYERLEKLVVMSDTWSLDNGLLTPSLKLKRAELGKRHAGNYLRWFSAREKVVWES